MQEIVEGVWTDRAPVSIVGMKLSSTMTVLRLSGDALLVYSPVPLASRRAAVEALGTVTHLYAPSLFHHLWVEEWANAYPDARVHVADGIEKKQPTLRVDKRHGKPEPAFDGVIDEITIDGFRLGESVLFHRASGTLLVADLVHNIGRPPGLWTKIYAGMAGFYGKVALSGMLRASGFSDKAAARASIDRILELPIERIIVGHGDPIDDQPVEALRSALAFLG